VRVGRPRGLIGLPDAHSGPGFATLAGLIHYAASDPIDVRGIKAHHPQDNRPLRNGLLEKLISAFKTGF
jgi:cell division protein FtsA